MQLFNFQQQTCYSNFNKNKKNKKNMTRTVVAKRKEKNDTDAKCMSGWKSNDT